MLDWAELCKTGGKVLTDKPSYFALAFGVYIFKGMIIKVDTTSDR